MKIYTQTFWLHWQRKDCALENSICEQHGESTNWHNDGLSEHCYDQGKGTGFDRQEWSCQEGALAGSSYMCLCKIMARPAITGKCGQPKRWNFSYLNSSSKGSPCFKMLLKWIWRRQIFLKHCMIWASRRSSLCPWKDTGMVTTEDFVFLLPSKA